MPPMARPWALQIDSPELAEQLLAGVVPTIWRFRALDPIAAAFNRHERVAFQFSGGRDSTATLYLLREYWNRMSVYYVDSGDVFPETRAVVERVAQDVPIHIIRSDVERVRQEIGHATDLLPADNMALGRLVSGRQVKLIGRYECCAINIMGPMHQRMRADGITLLVRGQRDADYAKPPMRSGDRGAGFEVLYPIEAWTGEQVEHYLRSNGLPVADYYREGTLAASAQVYVKPHIDRNGNYVEGHHRSRPNNTDLDNYGTRGNGNPYSGQQGTRKPSYETPYQAPPAPKTNTYGTDCGYTASGRYVCR